MAKMKEFMMDDGRFDCALGSCCDAECKFVSSCQRVIGYSTQEGVQKKSPSSPELLRFKKALLRHYRTKRMTNLKFKLFFRNAMCAISTNGWNAQDEESSSWHK